MLEPKRRSLCIVGLLLGSGFLALAASDRFVKNRDGWREHNLALSAYAKSPAATNAVRPTRVEADPAAHLPLMGMDAFQGDEKEACQRMEGFLISAGETLEKAGHRSPVELWLVPAVVADTTCSLDEPGTQALIAQFQTVWTEAGLASVGPLTE